MTRPPPRAELSGLLLLMLALWQAVAMVHDSRFLRLPGSVRAVRRWRTAASQMGGESRFEATMLEAES